MRGVKVKSIRSIERAFSVLNCFSMEERELTLNQLAEKTKLSRATLYRILHTLEKMEYIQYDPERNDYRLTMKLFELGSVASSGIHFRREISRFLDEMKTKTPYTILVATYYQRKLIYLDKRESELELKVGSEIGQIRSPEYGILGKTMLAFVRDEERQKIFQDLKKTMTKEELGALMRRLEEIRRMGYIFAKDETMIGIAGVAAPIFNHEHGIVAALGILAPSAGLKETDVQSMIELTCQTAKNISHMLGWRKEEKVNGEHSN